MNRDGQQSEELIDLGAASTETKGVIGAPGDELGFLRPTALSDD
jgi:hypothetical protein